MSPDSVGAPIFYREVNLPFADAVKDPSKIRWRFGSIASPTGPPVVLENLPVCGNCHSFSNDGAVLGMDVDYANDKGSYAVAGVKSDIVLDKSNIMTWMDYRRKDGQFTYGLLSRVSPTGRWVVSTVKDRSVFVPKPDLAFSQLFFPVKGILAVYAPASRSFASLPGADDPAFVQSNPAWSPDEKTILFIRAKAYELKTRDNGALLSDEECAEFTKGGKPFKYDIYSVPFNGGKGGVAKPFPGASQNGGSNFFPAFSPNGKFVVFCRSENYSLLQPDSRLYIIPASGGIARLMHCNRGRMNSWHSFSPNGRWLVFSSKEISPYTQLFLAHVDANGQDAPPVVLDYCTGPNRAANIPEFVNTSPDKIRVINERFIDDYSYVRAAQEPLRLGDIPAAIARYKTALSINPNNATAHFNLAYALEDQGDQTAAKEQYRLAIKADSAMAQAYNNLAILLSGVVNNEAEELYIKAIALQPGYADPHFNLGALLEQKGKYEEAANHFTAAIRLKPAWIQAFERLGDIRLKQKKMDLAQSAYMKALALDSTSEKAKTGLAAIRKR
jgi:tetratricopeptide (TPR) repeat protein